MSDADTDTTLDDETKQAVRRRASIPPFAIVEIGIWNNRKVRRAGFPANLVYVFALTCNAKHGRKGVFPASELDPWYLGDQLQIGEAVARQALQRAIGAELIAIEGDLALIIGWDETWARRSLTESEARQLRRQQASGDRDPEAQAKKQKQRQNERKRERQKSPDKVRTLSGQCERAPGQAEQDPKVSERTGTAAGPAKSAAIAQGVWDRVSAARVEIATELRIENVIPMPARFGMPSEPRGCRELRDRLREEGENAATVADHVVANLIAQAREEKSIEWLSEKAFTPGGWQTARNWLPTQSREPRKGPRRSHGDLIGSAPPRADHPDSPTLIPISEL